jgi:superfamily II DNA or RNA helicase
LSIDSPTTRWQFDADPAEFRLAAEALRIRMAGLHDPMVAVSSSAVEPLPHQIRAVYGELLPRTPLRFLLADDPGAGKTIMAGLYAKELMLRGDLTRMLIIAPGSLVEQWQDELATKFGINAELLSREMISGLVDGNPFTRYPILIARMDQLARNDELMTLLDASDWDLVIVDEAHRMSANWIVEPFWMLKHRVARATIQEINKEFLVPIRNLRWQSLIRCAGHCIESTYGSNEPGHSSSAHPH